MSGFPCKLTFSKFLMFNNTMLCKLRKKILNRKQNFLLLIIQLVDECLIARLSLFYSVLVFRVIFLSFKLSQYCSSICFPHLGLLTLNAILIRFVVVRNFIQFLTSAVKQKFASHISIPNHFTFNRLFCDVPYNCFLVCRIK